MHVQPPPFDITDKASIRKHFRLLRAAIPAETRQQHSDLIAQQLLALPEVQQSKVIFSYYNTPAEVSTVELLADLRLAGKSVWLPSTDRTSLPGELTVDAHAYADNYSATNPVPVPISDIDLVIVPAVAWDVSGYRVGYGGGYFDRLLERVRSDCHIIGLAYECQVTPKLPIDPWDRPVDTFITETQIRRFSGPTA